EACDLLGVKSLRDYVARPSGFFVDHLKHYSKSRRKAPLYWPLSTASGSYSVWVYYPRLTDQTLYTVVNRYLEPKVEDVQRRMVRIEADLPNASGAEATRLRDALHVHRKLLEHLAPSGRTLLISDVPDASPTASSHPQVCQRELGHGLSPIPVRSSS